MKKILLMLVAVMGLCSCGAHKYNTLSYGKDNVSFIVVLTAGQKYENVSVIVDNQTFPVEKVYKTKAGRKAHPIRISTGKHSVKVVSAGTTLVDENVFLGVQETKKIVLP
jgi:uncharacterized protein YxeA